MNDKKIDGAYRAAQLIVKCIYREISAEETLELETWVNLSDHNARVFNELTDPARLGQLLGKYEAADEKIEDALKGIRQRMERRKKAMQLTFTRVVKLGVAAAVTGLIIWSSYLAFKGSGTKEDADNTRLAQEITPGDGKEVVLTLTDGRKVFVNDAAPGIIAKQGNTQILRRDEQIIYLSDTSNGAPGINSIETPKGHVQVIVLPDGSKVWLNAVSKMEYPVTFAANERNVALSGEAYFEIAVDTSRPFHVSVGVMDVRVTGTKFNIKAYKNEAVITSTLFEGGIKVTQDGTEFSLQLTPGQQLRFNPETQEYKLVNPDLESTSGWKNGVFYLDSTDLPSLMREVSRWYDIEVEYPAGVPDVHLVGEIDRTTNLSELVKVLEENGIQAKLTGKRLIISGKQPASYVKPPLKTD